MKNREKRKHCRRRAAIEPIIGHLKQDHRVASNYLKGKTGDKINFIMAACGFNYKKLMKKLRVNALWLYTKWVVKLRRLVELTSFHQSRIQTLLKMSL